MRTLLLAVGIALAAYGQTGFGSLSGSVSNQAHAPASGLTVAAKNRTSSVELGFEVSYPLRHLP